MPMLDKTIYNTYVEILKSELVVALGCTEPIAIAYAGAKVREVLSEMPDSIAVYCSGNIIKNVKGVTVPHSGGQKGIAVAATLGVLSGDSSKGLAVLEDIRDEQILECNALQEKSFCECNLIEDVPNLYIIIKAKKGSNTAEVVVEDYHENIVKIVKNGEIIFSKSVDEKATNLKSVDKSLLSVKDILRFADEVELKDIQDVIGKQIECNTKIAEEGLKEGYGAQVGRNILLLQGESVFSRARAKAAAGSDARMGGCPLPVVINSGSGNQGITVSIPVIEYAQEIKASEEEMYRALVVSNLISIHQKRFIGSLSAYCGAVSAACGSAVGIAYLLHMNYEEICDVITNCIATIGGMVCDGAKPSCASKIGVALESAFLALQMSRSGNQFQAGEGLVKDTIEETIATIGYMGKVGMHSTDIEILNLMLDKTEVPNK